MPGKNATCCPNCNTVKVQVTCEIEGALGDCHDGSICNAEAECVPIAKAAGEQCRSAGVGGDSCDVGDVCDGSSLECPFTGKEGCKVGIDIAKNRVAKISCRAPNFPDFLKKATCEGEGSLADDGTARAVGFETSPNIRVMDLRRRVLKASSKTAPERRVALSLHLNAAGKLQLRNSASGRLNVRVVVRLNNGGTGERTVEKIVQFLRKGAK